MLDLLARSPALAEAIGRQGRRWVATSCGWEDWRRERGWRRFARSPPRSPRPVIMRSPMAARNLRGEMTHDRNGDREAPPLLSVVTPAFNQGPEIADATMEIVRRLEARVSTSR